MKQLTMEHTGVGWGGGDHVLAPNQIYGCGPELSYTLTQALTLFLTLSHIDRSGSEHESILNYCTLATTVQYIISD